MAANVKAYRKARINPAVTAPYIRNLLSYNRATGILRWKKNQSKKIKKGTRAGYQSKAGYIYIRVDYTLYLAHRLAWIIATGHFPKHRLDHKNGNKSDNRKRNLREATSAQDVHNRGHNKNSRSRVKGVHWNADCKRWHAAIQTAGKNKYLGLFKTKKEADIVYRKAANAFYKAFKRYR